MTAILVHGNPEAAAIWDELIPALDRDDVITLSPPGFGAPCPEGWGGTREDYVNWLISEIETIGEPVDALGHDWGGGHVMGTVLQRPDLFRSWAIDVAGIFHPDYVWHDMAQVWQTSGVGEEAVATMVGGSLEERTAAYVGLGMTEGIAKQVAIAVNEDMARCVLPLYRSAAQPHLSELGSDLSAATGCPGLVIIAEDDHYVGTEEMSRDTANRTNATVSVLKNVGHWWMIQDPKAGAAVLNEFWASLP